MYSQVCARRGVMVMVKTGRRDSRGVDGKGFEIRRDVIVEIMRACAAIYDIQRGFFGSS